MKDEAARIRAGIILDQAGAQTSHHYRPVHTMSYYAGLRKRGFARLEKTEEYAGREITLPLHPGLSVKDMDAILEILRKAVQ